MECSILRVRSAVQCTQCECIDGPASARIDVAKRQIEQIARETELKARPAGHCLQPRNVCRPTNRFCFALLCFALLCFALLKALSASTGIVLEIGLQQSVGR
jgi:hypothetical protein